MYKFPCLPGLSPGMYKAHDFSRVRQSDMERELACCSCREEHIQVFRSPEPVMCFLLPSSGRLSVWMSWSGRNQPSVCVLYVTLSLLPGHFIWGSYAVVLHIMGAWVSQFHFTSKSLCPMRSALVCSGKQEPSLKFFRCCSVPASTVFFFICSWTLPSVLSMGLVFYPQEHIPACMVI